MAVLKKIPETKRSEVINIRIEPTQRELIDTATSLCGKTRSAFMLDAACQAAQEALLDRRVFVLSDEQWEAFNQALDTPPKANPKLAQLLQTETPW